MNRAPSRLRSNDLPKTKHRWMAASVALSLLALAGCGGLKTKPADGVQLSGVWQLNQSLSDDPAALSRSGSMPPHGGGRGMGGPGGMGGGMGGPAGGMGGMGRGGGHMRGGGGGPGSRHAAGGGGMNMAALEQPKKLSIEQSANRLKLVEDGSPTDFVYGEKVIASFGRAVAERTSGWKAEHFVVTLKVEDGPTITRNYQVVDSGHQLIVETTASGGRGPERKFRSVYERAASSTG